MIITKTAIVTEVVDSADGLIELAVELEGRAARALAFEELSGAATVGDRVLLNVTAEQLHLGSGGYHFVICGPMIDSNHPPEPGHLMKLRYTPMQRSALSVEEPDSPYHELLREAEDLAGQPVVACGLHSQVLPIAVSLRAVDPNLRVAYVMTDGGALPAAYSRTVRWLKEEGYLATVITAGQAFGGDHEAVNLFSALLAAKLVEEADVTVVAMGPGIVGTGTALGHTGMEQGEIINATAALGGRPVAPLRLGQLDDRPRHHGLSHHSVSALIRAALATALVPLPVFDGEFEEFGAEVAASLQAAGIEERHTVKTYRADMIFGLLAEIADKKGPKASTMGRGISEEPAFFMAAAAVGPAVREMLFR